MLTNYAAFIRKTIWATVPDSLVQRPVAHLFKDGCWPGWRILRQNKYYSSGVSLCGLTNFVASSSITTDSKCPSCETNLAPELILLNKQWEEAFNYSGKEDS